MNEAISDETTFIMLCYEDFKEKNINIELKQIKRTFCELLIESIDIEKVNAKSIDKFLENINYIKGFKELMDKLKEGISSKAISNKNVDTEKELSFQELIVNALRRKPEYIVIGELRR